MKAIAPAIARKKWFFSIPLLGTIFSSMIMIILLYQVGIDFSTTFFILFIFWEVIGFIYFQRRLKYLNRLKENPFAKKDLSVFEE